MRSRREEEKIPCMGFDGFGKFVIQGQLYFFPIPDPAQMMRFIENNDVPSRPAQQTIHSLRVINSRKIIPISIVLPRPTSSAMSNLRWDWETTSRVSKI